MTLVVKSDDAGDNKNSPHLALCHEVQGFSANNRHVSLLMKSSEDGVEYTSEIIKAMQSVGLSVDENIIKAVFYKEKYMAISHAIKENFGSDEYYVYLEDFDDSIAIFCKGGHNSYGESGMYSVGYTMDALGMVTVEPLAQPVMTVTSYQIKEGKMELSEGAEDALEEGTMSLVKTVLGNEETQERLKDILIKKVTKKEGDENLPASAYAHIPDAEMSSTWKLRIDDANHVRAAVAALGEGFRGHMVEIPAKDLPAVKRRVKAAYRKFFPDAEELPAILKSQQEVSTLQEEIQKAVAEAEQVLKAQVVALTEQLEKANAKVEEFEKAQKEAVVKVRKEAIASVEKDEAKAEELFKSLESLPQDAFDVVIKSLKAKEEKLEDSDLFVQKSKNSDVEHEEINGTAAILKAKYAKQ